MRLLLDTHIVIWLFDGAPELRIDSRSAIEQAAGAGGVLIAAITFWEVALLASRGVVTMEFPHLQRLIEGNQFDTIYHEHFSYLSFGVVEQVFAAHGLTVFDVEELPTHGGSLRVFAGHSGSGHEIGRSVVALRERERELGYRDIRTYRDFGARVERTKRRLLGFLIDARERGRLGAVVRARPPPALVVLDELARRLVHICLLGAVHGHADSRR